MTINTVTPELLNQVDHAIINADLGESNLAPEYVIFAGVDYRYKVINDYDRLKRFRKGLELARNEARRRVYKQANVAAQIRYHNSARGQREAAARLQADLYDIYLR